MRSAGYVKIIKSLVEEHAEVERHFTATEYHQFADEDYSLEGRFRIRCVSLCRGLSEANQLFEVVPGLPHNTRLQEVVNYDRFCCSGYRGDSIMSF